MARVLVIEDHPANRRLMQVILRGAGCEVLCAQDALEGLAMAEAHQPVALMDIQLPGLDGLAATRRLRNNPRTRAIAVIVVTAHATAADEAQARQAGCDAYL